MSNDFKDTFNFIQKTIEKREDALYLVPKTELVDKFLNSESNNNIVKEFIDETKEKYTFELNAEINDKEVNELLSLLRNKYDSDRLKLLVDDCKASVMNSIIKPFGLAGVLFEDKLGGNVDTIHNVRNTDPKYSNGKGIYATKENEKKYEERGVYDSVKGKYHNHQNYISKNKEAKDKKLNNELNDEYRNEKIKRNEDINLDHTISAKEIHDDPGRVLAGLDGPDLACADSNLNITNESVNTSKGASKVDDFAKRLERDREKRQNRIHELKNKTDLSQKEEKELNKLKKLEDIDIETMKQKDAKARREYEKKVNTTYYTSKEFVTSVGKTSAKEGLKMGAQQAIGLLVREFALAVFDETKDIFSNRHNIKLNAEFLQSLRVRLERISKRVISKWKDVVVSFKDGAISGFFSNIITVIINTFFTTGERAVKIIREGFYSLLKALKMLMSPPENMSREESAHEATKLIASGLIITGGIAIEEVLQKSLATIPVIGIFSDILSTVILGIVTGLSMAFVVYLIDKIDLFKVNANKLQQYISNELNEMVDKDLEEYDNAYNYIASTLGI